MVFFFLTPLILLVIFLSVSTLIGFYLMNISTVENSKLNLFLYSIISSIIILASLHFYSLFTNKMTIDGDDLVGEYEIDKTMFPGANADWQHKKYRFSINNKDELIFIERQNNVEVKRCTVGINVLTHYESYRIETGYNGSCHHVLTSSPTIYRYPWSFHLIFKSPYYGNMYFKKR